jgi:hypothetical protein
MLFFLIGLKQKTLKSEKTWRIQGEFSSSSLGVYDLCCVIQIVLGFTWLLSNSTRKYGCIRREDTTINCIANDLKHVLIRSVITDTEYKISLLASLHCCENLFCNQTFTDSLKATLYVRFKYHVF